MHFNSNRLAVGILTLMGYDYKETENAYCFYSSDRKIVSYVPKKEYEVAMAKSLLENQVKSVYNNWCVSRGEAQQQSDLSAIYENMFQKVDKSCEEYKLALKKNLIFDPEKESVFAAEMQKAAA